MKKLFLFLFALGLVAGRAMGDPDSIDVLQIKESHEQGLKTTIQIGVTRGSGFAGQTFFEIDYAGGISKGTLPDGRVLTNEAQNEDHSLLGFNLQKNSRANEIYLMALTVNGVKAIDDVCVQLTRQLKREGVNAKPSDLYLETIEDDVATVCHRKSGVIKGAFNFKVKISNGGINIIRGTIRNIAQPKTGVWQLKIEQYSASTSMSVL